MTANHFQDNIFYVNKLHDWTVISIQTISSLAFSKIKPHMTVSLGGGPNVFNLAQEIAHHNEIDLTLCSPSELTRLNCQKLGLKVVNLNQISHIDLAFDGCDSVDYNFNALKSNGGIHLYEKLASQISDEYVLLVPPERITKELTNKVQLCIEVAPPCLSQILQTCKNLHLQAQVREDKTIASLAYTSLGNLLIDAYVENWKDILSINTQLSKQNGVVSTSYFHNLVTSLITTDVKDNAIEIKKGDLK